jgi:putative methyltransferase (TIGR04325 family)
VSSSSPEPLTGKLRRIAEHAGQLPGIGRLGRSWYRQRFVRAGVGNSYCGRYGSFEQARAAVPPGLPAHYNLKAAARMYRDQHEHIRACDYPLLHWLGRLFTGGQRRLFDLGGHIGPSYYGFAHYQDYPDDLQWLIHDTPATVAAGRAWAREHDPGQILAFADSPDAADGQDILLASGSLQYLDYTLAELLARLPAAPPHVLVNLTPMHASEGYFTLQHIGIAICPYRVMAEPDFVAQMQALGYVVVDHWQAPERRVRVPFEPGCAVDSYHGFYLRRAAQAPRLQRANPGAQRRHQEVSPQAQP